MAKAISDATSVEAREINNGKRGTHPHCSLLMSIAELAGEVPDIVSRIISNGSRAKSGR